jgi:hypothetical protein
MRTDLSLESAFGQASIVTVSDQRYLTVVTQPMPQIIVFDLQSWTVTCGVPAPIDGTDAVSAVVHNGGSYLTQGNRDGSLHVYRCPNGENVMDGAYVDGDLVFMDSRGFFEGTEDAAGYVEIAIPGLPGRHILSQFLSNLRRPGLTADVLAGRGPVDAPAIAAPPLLRQVQIGTRPGEVRLEAFSASGIDYIQLYADGRPLKRGAGTDNTAAMMVLPAERAAHRTLAAIAVDRQGIVSAPFTLTQPQGPPRRSGRLHVLAVGIDKYPKLEIKPLNHAASDAQRIARALGRSPLYAAMPPPVILRDEAATQSAILDGIERLVRDAKPEDTIVLSFAGHAIDEPPGTLRLLLPASTMDDLEATSLPFELIASRVKSAKARVVVLLDVCHAGLADNTKIATNDAVTARLATDSGASMIVLAASKGR